MAIATFQDRVSTGVGGLDSILGGGLTPSRMYLLEGSPGTGKTTFAMRFLMSGAERGERGLYITLSETASELRAVADSHQWALTGIDIYELVDYIALAPEIEQSILHPSEVELGETIKAVTREIERINPTRVVFDSLSEMRLLAQDPLRYRRQILALKHFFSGRECTVLLLDDKTSDPTDLQLHSISHGVINLDQVPQLFGTERRRLRVVKMRGIKFEGGYHDFALDTGKVEVFPRLIAAAHHSEFDPKPETTGSAALDEMLGGGLVRGTNTLLLGPSGVGKTSTAVACMVAALARGQRSVYYLFDEGLATLLTRSRGLGMDLQPHIESGLLTVEQVDPASLSPGEFAFKVMTAVNDGGASFMAIDSLNAYLLAMPEQSFLLLHMHELISFLNQRGVITLLVVGQHGLVGEMSSDVDLSYLSDSLLLYRFFEANGKLHTAISAVKSRTLEHERTIREFRLTGRGLEVGDPLHAFEGVLSGVTTYRGATPMLGERSNDLSRPAAR